VGGSGERRRRRPTLCREVHARDAALAVLRTCATRLIVGDAGAAVEEAVVAAEKAETAIECSKRTSMATGTKGGWVGRRAGVASDGASGANGVGGAGSVPSLSIMALDFAAAMGTVVTPAVASAVTTTDTTTRGSDLPLSIAALSLCAGEGTDSSGVLPPVPSGLSTDGGGSRREGAGMFPALVGWLLGYPALYYTGGKARGGGGGGG
jgi:hypothetical protein